MIKDLEYDRNFDKAAAGFERIVYKLERSSAEGKELMEQHHAMRNCEKRSQLMWPISLLSLF